MRRLSIYLLIATFVFAACNKEDDKPTPGLADKVLGGDVTSNLTLDANVEYTLDGTLAVKDGVTLTIPAGTVIKAKKGFSNYVIVERGGKIMAQGTSVKPIKFTSEEASPAAGDWGGLVINGKAPISGATAGTESATEVDNNKMYGGTNIADNSGVLEYVILEYTGAKSTASIEHNGLTLNAVGSGTKIENIYVPYTSDDGIEFFGGSVNVSNLLIVNPDDDMFDFTQGYSGTLKNAYGVWPSGYTSAEEDPRGIEADGNLDGNGPTHLSQSNFKIENLTIANLSTTPMEDVIKIRRGATATITNALLSGGFAKDLIDLTDSKGDASVTTAVNATNSGFDAINVKNPAAGAASVTVAPGNAGTDKALFAWTGYTFGGTSTTTETLSGNITANRTLNATITYTLDGTVAVKSGATLTIPAGTLIKGKKGFSNYLIVERGGKIIAKGTAANPVKFTSAEASPAAGDWGGLVINGKAPISGATAGTESATEVDNNLMYGGTDITDNSGILEYVILEYTGAKSTANIEHNGLTLNAVGNGTKIENIYVPHTSDDGIEFFGGSVNVTNLLVVNPDDDMFDFTQGYSGTLKNAYGVWPLGYTSAEEDPRGIEADGNLDGNGPTHVNQSNFKIENITILNNSTFKMTDIIKVRRGATANITNAWVNGGSVATDVIDLTDNKGEAGSATSILYKDGSSVTNSVKNTNPASTLTVTESNTGTDKTLFSWTGASL